MLARYSDVFSFLWFCMLVPILLVACGQPQDIKKDHKSNATEEVDPYFFYRMKAEFLVKETGEQIKFDYIVACGGTIWNYSYTSPSAIISHSPAVMFQPVSGGAALGIQTIDMCESFKWGKVRHGPLRGQNIVPENLRPIAIWYEDISDLSFGWGYRTDAAYESPLSKIEFVEANVSKSTKSEWRAWRKQAEENYEQIGSLPGPWGYDGTQSNESWQNVRALGKGNGIGAGCGALSKIPLDQKIVDEIFAEAPDGVGRYWVLADIGSRNKSAYRKIFDEPLPDGAAWEHYNNADPVNLGISIGTLSRNGGGHLHSTSGGEEEQGYVYRDVFPLLTRSASMPNLTEPPDVYVRELLTDPKYNGFGACKTNWHPVDALGPISDSLVGSIYDDRPRFDVDGYDKPHRILIDGELAFGEPYHSDQIQQTGVAVLDREGFIFYPLNK